MITHTDEMKGEAINLSAISTQTFTMHQTLNNQQNVFVIVCRRRLTLREQWESWWTLQQRCLSLQAAVCVSSHQTARSGQGDDVSPGHDVFSPIKGGLRPRCCGEDGSEAGQSRGPCRVWERPALSTALLLPLLLSQPAHPWRPALIEL